MEAKHSYRSTRSPDSKHDMNVSLHNCMNKLREELQEMNLNTFTVSRGMTNTMADIKGVDIWVNFTESEKGVLCELRSNRYNINPIAVKYGGGGHAKASGATVADKETAMATLHNDWNKTNFAISSWYPEVVNVVATMPEKVQKVIAFAEGSTKYVFLTPMQKFIQDMRKPRSLEELLNG